MLLHGCRVTEHTARAAARSAPHDGSAGAIVVRGDKESSFTY